MKRFLSLLLALSLLLPVFALAESDDDLDVEEIVEEVSLDEEETEDFEPEDKTGEKFVLTEEEQDEVAELLSKFAGEDAVVETVDEDSLYINPNLPDHVVNILLLGVDSRNTDLKMDNDTKRADVQIILSFDTLDGSIKLSSILRDTLITVPGTDKKKVITNSYQSYDANGAFHDSPESSVRTVNYNFEMNIRYYVTINFYGVISIIDHLGGIDLELSKAEAKAINAYLKKNARAISRTYDTDEARAKRETLQAVNGVQHLDGMQALMYARLRENLGGDWERTARTRRLLDTLLQTVLKEHKDVFELVDLLELCLSYVSCNMNLETMGNLMLTALRSGIMDKLDNSDTLIEQFRIPMDKTWKYADLDGKSVVFMSKNNFQKNREALHEFIYGQYYPASAE
jgi:LCP family protein required for cell wall assembly